MRALSDAGRALLAAVLGRLARMTSSRAGVVIVYHRVGGAASGDEDFEILPAVSDRVFERQLRHFRGRYRVVPAAQIVDAARLRRRGQRFPIAITFDDDLAEHVRAALPALRRTGVTATFFLTGASLDESHSFWWEDLQRAIDDTRVTPDQIPYVDLSAALERSPRAILDVAGKIVRLAPEERDEVTTALRTAVGPAPTESGLRAHQIRALADAGCSIGFHTVRHDPLQALPDAELDRALREGRQVLEAAAGGPVDLIAYPHGKADDRVATAARRAGFAAGFTTASGVVTPETNPLRIPRTVADLSSSSLALRLARLVSRARG